MKSIKMMTLMMISVAMTGCSNETIETTPNYTLPPELTDCKIFNLKSVSGLSNSPNLTITRCPNSSTTTYVPGKSSQTSTIIDGKYQ